MCLMPLSSLTSKLPILRLGSLPVCIHVSLVSFVRMFCGLEHIVVIPVYFSGSDLSDLSVTCFLFVLFRFASVVVIILISKRLLGL